MPENRLSKWWEGPCHGTIGLRVIPSSTRRCLMVRKVQLILCLGLVLVIGAACATVQGQKGMTTETIKPSGIHEDCFEMAPGQILDYSFEATKPVDFNIHFHEDSGIS